MDMLDVILTVGSIVIGIMLLTGHGSFFMSGGDTAKRNRMYDEKKVEKASGVTLLIIGIATGIDHFMNSVASKIGYITLIVVVLGSFVYYMKTKCKK